MLTPEEIKARRARERARRQRLRRQRIVASLATLAVAALVLIVFVFLPGTHHRAGKKPKAAASHTVASTSPHASSKPTPSPSRRSSSPTPSPLKPTTTTYTIGGPAPRPPIVNDYIAFGAKRRAEMATYALRHYGTSDITLQPKLIVLHYTASSNYASVHALFEQDVPNMGVLPGVVAHFVVDKDGTIYQQLPLDLMGRHAVGLNYCAIGIENVQEGRATDAEAVAQIMARAPQQRALIALVRWLMYRYDIPLQNVIGHGMANQSPYFKDLLGWTNDHTDWQRPEVMRFRAALK